MIFFSIFVKPHVIVHCAAERRPDVVERHTEAAMNLNVNACTTLAKEAGWWSIGTLLDRVKNVIFPTKVLSNPFSTAGIFLIYISTDYVFDGRNPPYGENDAPNPLNLYGKSKLEGEREILRHCPGI